MRTECYPVMNVLLSNNRKDAYNTTKNDYN